MFIIYPLLFCDCTLYAMEDSRSVDQIREDIDYWQLQARTYTEAKSTIHKPESTWSHDEKLSVQELKEIGEYSQESIENALKEVRKNLSSSQRELANAIPKFSNTPGEGEKEVELKRTGDSSINPTAKRS